MDEVISKQLFGECDNAIIRNRFEMTETDVMNGMNMILDWYKLQPHLPEDALDYCRIERLYGWSKYNIEKTKQKIENLLLARASIPEIFVGRDPTDFDILTAMDCIQYCFISQLTPENNRVFICRYTDTDPKFYNPPDCMRAMFMIWDLKLRYDCSVGDICIVDCGHFKLGHALKIAPSMIKKCIYVSQECYGTRIEQIHIVNLPSYAQTMLGIIKLTMKKKVVDRIIVHDKIENLQNFIPKDCLPKDYGGSAASCDELVSGVIKKLMQTDEWKNWYAESEIKIADKSKIPKKEAANLGIIGSLRKLFGNLF